MANCKGEETMTDASGNTNIVKEKIDEAMNKFKETGKPYGFNICSTGKEITATEVEEGDGNFMKPKNSCPGQIGSFHIHPEIKDAIPSSIDIGKS